MNNMLKRLMVAALALSATHLSAYTNKNYLSVARPQHASLLRDSHLTRDLESVKGKDRFGGNFLVSGYYSESRNSAALGKYFGFSDQDKFDANAQVAANDAKTLDLSYIIHDHAADNDPANKLSFSLAPKTTSYGVEFAYTQCLGKILEGLYLEIGLPVERVENDMNLKISGATAAQVTMFQNYFNGTYSKAALAGNTAYGHGAGANNAQGALTKALFKGKQNATGIADIDVVLGYNFLRNEDWKAGLNLGLVIPTGNTPNGVYVFEPIYGNGGHWELGFGGQLDGKLWNDADQRINLHASLDYRYGFQANETRTLGVKGATANWSQYDLAGVLNSVNTSAVPSANGLTQSLSVTPQSKIKGNLGLEYGNGGFLVGVHYAPAWKQEESVKNGKVAAGYGIVAPGYDLTANANLVAAAFLRAAVDADLDQAQATRPSQVEHRLGADLGYTFRNWEYPVMIGVGGHYAFAGENSAAENWGINLKAGIGF